MARWCRTGNGRSWVEARASSSGKGGADAVTTTWGRCELEVDTLRPSLSILLLQCCFVFLMSAASTFPGESPCHLLLSLAACYLRLNSQLSYSTVYRDNLQKSQCFHVILINTQGLVLHAAEFD